MNKSKKNGNKRKNTQGKKNAPSGQNKKNPIRRNGDKPRKIAYRQVRIFVRDPSQIVPAAIYGASHYPGNINPGFKVVVSDDPEQEVRKIGKGMAVIYSATA
jgi:hypothetical protein